MTGVQSLFSAIRNRFGSMHGHEGTTYLVPQTADFRNCLVEPRTASRGYH